MDEKKTDVKKLVKELSELPNLNIPKAKELLVKILEELS